MSARFSEPLVLFSGLPGSGKTLSAITFSVEARKEGQRIFQVGITDCNDRVAELWCPDGCNAALMRGKASDSSVQAERLKAVARWRELPSGSVLILDEAQDFFPVRGPGRPPEWIADLAKVRHFGVQIWFCTQDPRNIDSFVRRLVGNHVHIERKAGSKTAVTFTWPKVKEDTDDFHSRKSASKGVLKHKKEYFQYYTSATQHLIRRKIPWQMWLAVPVCIATIVALFFSVRLFMGHSQLSESADKKKVAAGGSATGVPGGLLPSSLGQAKSSDFTFRGLSDSDYAMQFIPRLPGLPWSARAFDDRKVSSQPEAYCVISDRLGCSCYSEQMTPIEVGVPQCKNLALHGAYNPFRSPRVDSPSVVSVAPVGVGVDGGPRSVPPGVSAGARDRSAVSDASVSSGVGQQTPWPRVEFNYQVPFPGVSHGSGAGAPAVSGAGR